MHLSREFTSADYLCSDSPEEEEEREEERRGGSSSQPQDFDFIDVWAPASSGGGGGGGGGGSSSDLSMTHPASAASLKCRASTVLTEKIIAEISDSILVFKPSRSLHQLVSDRAEEEDREEGREGDLASIDLVVSGGGLKGYFVCGCVSVLQRQLAHHNIRIARVSGASAGAWSAFFVCTGISTALWMESYYKCYDNPKRTIHEVYEEEMWPIVRELLPVDAYQHCSGRLHISITVVSAWGRLTNHVISEYTSNEDLFEACLASSTIPYITERGAYRLYRGMKVVDGGLTNNTPVFRDGVRRQMIFRLSQIEYPWRLLINPVDTCIDALVIRGALQMSRFLSGEHVPAIAWLEQRQGEQDLVRPGHSVRRVVAPVAALSLICFRTSFLPYLFDFIDAASATGTTIGSSMVNFHDAEAVFQDNPFFYVCGTAFAALVSVLRRLHLLL